MSENLQSLLEKINRDGVEKAQAEADRIIGEAKVKAAAIVKEAQEVAARAQAEADKSAAEYASRAEATICQAARDTVLSVEGAVTRLLERVLTKDVDLALADEKTALALVSDAIKAVAGEAEVAVAGAKLASALKAQLAAQRTIQVTLDETLGTGFSVKLDGGRVEHTFTGDAISAELAKRLRADLAKLVK